MANFPNGYTKMLTVGDVAELKTNAKDKITNAINEVVDNNGDLTTLKTTVKDTVVNAVNELKDNADALQSYDVTTNKNYAATSEQKQKASPVVGHTKQVSGYGSVAIPNNAKGNINTSIKGSTVRNVGGSVGDCENTSDFGAISSVIDLDSTNKVFGSKSIVGTSIADSGTPTVFYVKAGKFKIDATKYYLVSAYVRNIDATDVRLQCYKGSDLTTIGVDSAIITGTTFTRVGLVLQPSNLTGETSIRPNIRATSAGVGTKFAADGIMVNEISATEYALGVSTLLQRYPYISDTKSTISASRMKSVGKNLERDNTRTTANTGWVSDFGTIIPIVPNTVIYLKQNVIGSHRPLIRFYDANKNQITTGVVIPSYNTSTFTYSETLKGWVTNSNDASLNILITVTANPNIAYVQFGITNGSVASSVTAKDILVSQIITAYEPYVDSLSYLPNAGELRSVPSGVKDEICATQS